MMIALLLALQSVPALQALPRQALPARGCAAYLWSRADRRLVALAGADPASLRIALDGRATDYPRDGQTGAAAFGFAERTTYRSGDVTLTLDIAVAPREDLADGAAVPDGALTVTRAGGDAVVVPVAGLIGCRPAADAPRGLEIRPGSVR